jgi:predicted secreted protein
MTEAISSFGTLLKIGDGATPTENFTTIAEVQDISGPGLEQRTEEVTHHGSTGGWVERIGTLLDAGEVGFDINFLPTHATQDPSTGLIADMKNRTKRNFQLVFPDGSSTTWEFTALVTGFEPDEPVEGKLSASVTLEVTGQPTLT